MDEKRRPRRRTPCFGLIVCEIYVDFGCYRNKSCESPRIKALDDDLWAALGDVVSENALLGMALKTRGSVAVNPHADHKPSSVTLAR